MAGFEKNAEIAILGQICVSQEKEKAENRQDLGSNLYLFKAPRCDINRYGYSIQLDYVIPPSNFAYFIKKIAP